MRRRYPLCVHTLYGFIWASVVLGLLVFSASRLPTAPPPQLYTLADWNKVNLAHAREAIVMHFGLPGDSDWTDLESLFVEGVVARLHARVDDRLPRNTPVTTLLVIDATMSFGEQLNLGRVTNWEPVINEFESRFRAGGLDNAYGQILFLDQLLMGFWENRVNTLFPPLGAREPPVPRQSGSTI